MPPKSDPKKRRVSMAPGSKIQDGAAATTLSKGNYRKVGDAANSNPIKRSTVPRQADMRKARNAYAQQIAAEQAEQERDKRDLMKKISDYRKENAKLLKNQRLKWGMTFDEMEVAKEQLQQAKENNDVLYKELEIKKDDCEKLESELQKLTSKISNAMLDLNDLNRDRKLNELDRMKLDEANRRAAKLYKSNRDLRSILLRNKIDPNVDALTMKKFGEPNGPIVKPRLQRTPPGPELITRENLLSFRSMDDMRGRKKGQNQNSRRTRSQSHQTLNVSPKLFLTQYPDKKFGKVEVSV